MIIKEKRCNEFNRKRVLYQKIKDTTGIRTSRMIMGSQSISYMAPVKPDAYILENVPVNQYDAVIVLNSKTFFDPGWNRKAVVFGIGTI